MLKTTLKRVVPLAAIAAAMALAPVSAVNAATAGQVEFALTSPMRQDTEPVTIYGVNAEVVPSWDPQVASDSVSIPVIENLFLGLTDVDPQTTKIRPELATSWEVNEAGDVWTFTVRNDVPWVRYDPTTQEVVDTGEKVTAADIEYGMKRSCDPRLGATYTAIAAALLKGCDVVAALDPTAVTDADFDQIGVKALSDTQLEVTTQGVLGFFESTTPFWIFRPVPKATIEEFGDKWTDVGNYVTNGPFVLSELDPNVNRVFIANPFYPDDINDDYGGNIERVSTVVITDGNTQFSLYLNNQIDSGPAPAAELDRIRQDAELSTQLIQGITLSTFYFAFAQDKEPFDKVEVRRAFSAVVDRNAFVQDVRNGRGIPIAHFMPPGILGAVPVNEVGVGSADNLGFDPEYAKAQMEAAGFPGCEGLPDITIAVYQGAEAWAEFLQNGVNTHLCDSATPANISIEALEFGVLLQAVEKTRPTAERPQMWTLGWGADYPDGHNWMHDVLGCNSQNPFLRPCDATDELIDEAAKETDSAKRVELYAQTEEQFFGEEGSFPIIPLYIATAFSLVKPWYTGFFDTDGLFGGPHWNSRKIDQEAQLAARGGANQPVVIPTAAATP
jgi:oligopeptide transport system substrate-binding protein